MQYTGDITLVMEFAELSDDNYGDKHGPNNGLTIEAVRSALKAEALCCEDRLDAKVHVACGCDLMSDVLAFTKPGALLLTGLTNSQVIRTAELLDLKCVIFVRDKMPDDDAIEMAKELGIPLLTSPYPLYESCGMLYAMGLKGCMNGNSGKTDL